MASSITVPVPLRAPATGGLLAVANVIDSTDPHILQGVQYTPDGCEFPLLTPGDCWVSVNPPDVENPEDPEGPDIPATEKTLLGIPDVPTPVTFVLHAAVQCFAGPDEDFLERAERILSQGESFAIERVLFDVLNAETSLASEADLAAAIARVEGWLGANYPAQGLLHLDRRQASLAAETGSIRPDNEWVMHTRQGLPVANGSGYGSANGAARSPNTIFGSGQVNIWRSEANTVRALNPQFNTELALVERAYAFTVDCDAIVKVTVGA